MAGLCLVPWISGGITLAWTGSAGLTALAWLAGWLLPFMIFRSMLAYETDKARQEAMGISDRIMAAANPLILQGYTPDQVREAVLERLGIGIGGGSTGDNPSVMYAGPGQAAFRCPYCGATAGGGHGGLCPNAAADS